MAADSDAASDSNAPYMQFTWSPRVDRYNCHELDFFEQTYPRDRVVVGAVVLNAARDRVLLVQRAANDSLPGLWEVPGGMLNRGDVSILHAAARELWEESCLRAKHIAARTAMDAFALGGGQRGIKYFFLVEVGNHDEVKLCADEHQNFVWATEEEAKAGRCGDVKLEFTSGATLRAIARAFELAK